MKTIVCYGDSNTWGFMPKVNPPQWAQNRYPRDVRWPGVMRSHLGPDYWVEEEGLNGRTTYLDDPMDETRNGLKYLATCMQTKLPVDLAVIMLGTNDVKGFFGVTPLIIARGVARLVDHIQKGGYGPDGAAPEILIIAPPLLHENIVNAWPGEEFGPNAIRMAAELGVQYEKIAAEYGVYFLNADCLTADPADGVHINAESHAKLGCMVAEKVKTIFT